MRVERRIFRNTAVLAIGEIVGQLANFAFVVLLTRRFGVEHCVLRMATLEDVFLKLTGRELRD